MSTSSSMKSESSSHHEESRSAISKHNAPEPIAQRRVSNEWLLGLVAVLFIALIFLLVQGYSSSKSAIPTPTVIVMENSTFNPSNLTVPIGTLVSFRDNDGLQYDVVVTNGPQWFDSGPIYSGQDYNWTFSTNGTYTFAETHYGFTGQISVK